MSGRGRAAALAAALAAASLAGACVETEPAESGRWIVRHQTAAGEVKRPGPWDEWIYDVLVEGPGGELDTIAPVIDEEGRFLVGAAGPGELTLRLVHPETGFTHAFPLGGGAVVIEEVRLGRHDLHGPAEGTELRLALDGLVPWQPGHELQILVAGAGVVDRLGRLPVPESSARLDLSLPWPHALPDGRAGDQLLVGQLVPSPAGRTLRRLYAAPAATFVGGEPIFFEGEAEEVEQLAIPVNLILTDVAEHLSPEAVSSLWALSLPAAGAYGHYGRAPVLGVAFPPSGSDLRVTMRYGDPFAVPFETFLLLFSVHRPGLSPAGASELRAVFPPAAARVAPLVSPVRDLAINGRSAFEEQTGIGVRPTLSWSPPELGTPARYEVLVMEYLLDRPIALVRATGTAIRIPPDLLRPGIEYYFEVTARLPRGLPGGSASIATAPVVP